MGQINALTYLEQTITRGTRAGRSRSLQDVGLGD